jgi:ATP-dependent exoDNAse (exonuclease V) alpha subunit
MTTQLQFSITDLNDGQKEAFEGLSKFITEKSNDQAVLRGYAGTGKTYLVKKLINYIHKTHPSYKIAVTAPTNKAVRVLSKSSSTIKDLRVTYQTIHKLLGLKEVIHTDGKITFESEFKAQNEINNFKVLIVDEVSMLDDALFTMLQQYVNRVKIIYMGDPAQIPPVNKPDCIPFNDEKKIYFDFREFTLTEIMRQSLDNPIIESSFEIRNNLVKRYPIDEVKTKLNEKDHGIIRINPNHVEDRDKAMQLFEKYFKCREFEENADHAKVVAWRNVTVDKTNKIIRNIIYSGKELTKIMEGEKLIVRKPIIDGMDMIVFTTSEELVVEEFSVASDVYQLIASRIRLKYYDTVVSAYDIEGKEYQRNIKILHEDSQFDFDKAAEALKANAVKTKGANRSWGAYYDFLRTFADVGYNYCTTCHKCQGSTYTNVFIIEDDLDLNSNILERNRIKYTAYSRASEKLFILKR